MLTSLTARNFKAWRELADVRLAPITGFFGPNSSGKTSILQLLLLLKQTAESPDRAQVLNLGDDRSPVALGSFRDIVFGHDLAQPLEIALSWREKEPIEIADPAGRRKDILFHGDSLRFDVTIRGTEKGLINVESFAYALDGSAFEMSRKDGSGSAYELVPKAGAFRFRRAKGRPWPLPAPVKCYGFPDEVRAYFQNAGFLSELELAFERLMQRIYYLGPLREYPRRQYIWSGGQPEDVGPRGERAVDALLASRARQQVIARGRGKKRHSLDEHVAHWLRELGLIEQFKVEEIEPGSNLYRVTVRKGTRSAPVLVTDVGFGVSQVLPVLVLCFYVPEGSTVILEQPEIHLHPAVQAGLADALIEAVQLRKIQVIVESHSEHLLHRLQRRVAEEAISADQLALYFCDVADGLPRLSPLELNVFGEIENWPEDFFGDAFSEVVAMQSAAARRRRQGEVEA